MADRIVPGDVAIVGNGAAARALASDLAARGVEVAIFPSPDKAGAEHRFVVCFNPPEPDAAHGPGDGSRFYAGAALRPHLADPNAADALAHDDARNLGWKLALVVRDTAPAALLDSYERERGAVEPGAPIDYATSPLTSQFGIDKKFRAGPLPGAAMIDAPVRITGRADPVPLADVCGGGFSALFFTGDYDALPAPLTEGLQGFQSAEVPLSVIVISAAETAALGDFPLVADTERALHRRYGAMTGAFYLVRPDGVIAARWQHPSLDAISAALRRATGHTDASARPARSSGW